MEEKKKFGSAKVIISIILILAIAGAAVYFIFFNNKNHNNDQKASNSKTTQTEFQIDYTITPCDKEDAELFEKALPGSWSSYNGDGVPFTYIFDEDGSVRYKKDGENAKDFTYSFKDGMLTIKGAEKSFVYQCSKDAVGMMAKMPYGSWQAMFAEIAKTIPDFNGCIYIVDDIMYMGSICLVNDKNLDGYDSKTLEGEWVGVKGDTIRFDADGGYTYVGSGDTYHGTYKVDADEQQLYLTLNGKTTQYSKDKWGLDGRFFHIGNTYYIKLAK